jgi:uncharacterized protein YfaS (alpha-2-macroglobulin family)
MALVAVLAMPVQAQQTAEESAQPAAEPGSLKIAVLEGEGAKNDIRAGVAVAPKIEVRDQDGKPVQGVEVVFRLPMTGASGVFSGWVKTQTVRTDEYGQASVTGYTPNDTAGRFNIKVTAKSGTKTASAVIAQSNVKGAGGKAGSSKKWWILAAVGAGAGVAIGVAATRNGDSGTVTSPVVISAGPVTISGPK